MIYSQQTDETLVSLSLLGQDAAYEELVRRWERAVIGTAYRVTRNHYLSEDAAQDAFVSAWMKLNNLREPSKYGAWVCRIARNRAVQMTMKYRDEISVDFWENTESGEADIPDELLLCRDESESLRDAVDSLAPTIREVIRLHYYEGLSIAEIADRLHIPAGTVKWRLSDGRDRLRKEFGVVDEKFVRRVMEKVEELKRFRLRGNKTGFEEAYRDVLADIDKLPESKEKYHAMADVLRLGCWWLPGKNQKEMLAQVREAAQKGHNDEVMSYVAFREYDVLSGMDRIEFMRDKLIPRLEAEGYPLAQGHTLFWLGYEYCARGEAELGRAAHERALEVLPVSDVMYANALSALKAEKLRGVYAEDMYKSQAAAEEYQIIDGQLRAWSQPGYHMGNLIWQHDADYITWNAAGCDRRMFVDGMAAGESITGTDGCTLTFAADCETVETPAGVFEGCELWITRGQRGEWRTWFKRDVGIVKQTGEKSCRLLKSYRVSGGGLFPMAAGNRWEYDAEKPDTIQYENIIDMVYAGEKSVTLALHIHTVRTCWDENSWEDMILWMRTGYIRHISDEFHLSDVSHAMERAEALAATPAQRLHTTAACSVMRRIFATDREFNPNRTASGHWNFFQRYSATVKDGRVTVSGDRTYSFEWKNMGNQPKSAHPLLCNHLLGILMDNLGCIWSDEWKAGLDTDLMLTCYGKALSVHLAVTDAGTVATGAGSFDGCLCVTMNAAGFEGGYAYRGGHRYYIFAPGVGIVKMVNHWDDTEPDVIYELTSYSGTGEGFFPMGEGFMRRYDAIGLRDGYEASSVYTMAQVDGEMFIFADQCGIRQLN
ncbi:MAG: RNA polymerase sigma factor [Clostridia bacterium]|nr:RNA polymerase sigma factor [Clostridia bacterium]